jgi:tripartite-type tricarboxylate transporter receptor subunit TctC
VAAKLQSGTLAAVASATLREKFMQQGAEPVGGGARELAELLRSDLVRWRKVVADTHVQID